MLDASDSRVFDSFSQTLRASYWLKKLKKKLKHKIVPAKDRTWNLPISRDIITVGRASQLRHGDRMLMLQDSQYVQHQYSVDRRRFYSFK